jgi:uncharacterized membrane protein YfcA
VVLGLLDVTWGLLAAGLLAGFLSTLFGIGGGLVMVPMLAYGLHYDFVTATALSLLAMSVQTPWGVYQHHRRGAVDWRLGWILAAGGVPGVLFGVWLQPRLSVPGLKLLFAVVMLLAAVRLWMQPVKPGADAGMPTAGVFGLGAGAGLVSRLLGIGGGLVTVPVLAITGTPMHKAVASSLVAVSTNAMLAAILLIGAGVDWKPAVALTLGALAASPLGTALAHSLKGDWLRRAFALPLVAGALYIIVRGGA